MGGGGGECLLCGDKCESVSHVLWECPVSSCLRKDFMCKLQEYFGYGYECVESLDSFDHCVVQ